jgi:NTE family protein
MDVTLALGGGGSKGYAHIGVIRALEASGIRIKAIAGTSAGGLFGGIYAAGYRYDDLFHILEKLDQGKLYSRQPGDGPSLMGIGGLTQILEEFIGDTTIESLPVPIAMTGVDLETGEKVILDRGSLLDAIQATIALPGIFPPKLINNRLIIDGGIIDPVPVGLARSLRPDLPVVAVVLSPKMKKWTGQQEPPSFMNSFPLINRLYKLRLAQSLNIFIRSVDIAGGYLTEMTLETLRPEVIIRPDVGEVGLVDAVNITDLIEKGEKAAAEALPALEVLTPPEMDWAERLSERMPWLAMFFGKTAGSV